MSSIPATMPVASAIASASSSDAPILTVDEIVNGLRGLTMSELVRVSKALALESEKKFKVFEKSAVKKPKKAGSMPKGVLPRQFLKPNAWKAFVMADAKANGWPAFTVSVKRKNKETGEVEVEETELSASVIHEGVRVFDTGRAFNEKDAMSLSKIYWDNKAQTGSRKDLWDRFDAQYVEEPVRSSSVSSATPHASAPPSASATPVLEPAKPAVMKRAPKKSTSS